MITIYDLLEWIPKTKRQTGDLDIVVQFPTADEAEYKSLKDGLLAVGYRPDEQMSYRLHSPKKTPGSVNYVDLLIMPSASCSEQEAQRIMGVGSEFAFRGLEFAFNTAIELNEHLLLPTPFGLILLKSDSYTADPWKRIRDLADIIEVAIGLVKTAFHYELKETWTEIKRNTESKVVIDVLEGLSSENSTHWDIGNAEFELKKRGFNDDQLANEIPFLISALLEELEN